MKPTNPRLQWAAILCSQGAYDIHIHNVLPSDLSNGINYTAATTWHCSRLSHTDMKKMKLSAGCTLKNTKQKARGILVQHSHLCCHPQMNHRVTAQDLQQPPPHPYQPPECGEEPVLVRDRQGSQPSDIE